MFSLVIRSGPMRREDSSVVLSRRNTADLLAMDSHVSVNHQIDHNIRNIVSGSSRCTLSCGFFSFFTCAPLTCLASNPAGCLSTSTSTCPTGYTTSTSGSKCFKLVSAGDDWLNALQTCIADGGATLAKIESTDDNTDVAGLLAGQVSVELIKLINN